MMRKRIELRQNIGTVLHYSRNLRGPREWTGKRAADVVYIDRIGAWATVRIVWPNGDYCVIPEWFSVSHATDVLSRWRNLRGIQCVINGARVGPIDPANDAYTTWYRHD